MSSTTSTISDLEGKKPGPPDMDNPDEVTQHDPEKQPSKPVTIEPQYVTGLKLWLMMCGVTLVCFIVLLDMSIVSAATPKITSHFHSLENVGWYGAAYQLSAATLQPLTGKAYSHLNLKWTFMSFFFVFEVGSLLSAVATSSNMFIVGRAVAGIGASGLQNGALTIISGAAPMHKRPLLMGIVIGFGQIGLVAGPLIGGVLTEFASWRWCFYINLPIGAIVAIVLFFTPVPEQVVKGKARDVLPKLYTKLDLIGFAIFAPASIMLLLAVQWGGNTYAWDSATVIGLICGAVATFLVWCGWNYHMKDEAMVPFSILRQRSAWTSCLMAGGLAAAMFLNSYYLPIYFQGVRGRSPAISGVFLLPGILSQLVAGILAGKLIGSLGYYLPWATLSSVLATIAYGLLSTLAPTTSTGKWVGYQIIGGAGRGLGLTVPFIAVQNNLQPAQLPVAMALIMTTQTYFGALFLSFADTIFVNSLRSILQTTVHGVDADAIAHAGAYAFRKIVPEGVLPAVLRAYATSVGRVFYMCIALGGMSFAASWGLGWVDVREKPKEKATEALENTEEREGKVEV